tara:strand:- start:228 stop:404 length:177 start_codon:yes stop_codon:yes gene_type:complete
MIKTLFGFPKDPIEGKDIKCKLCDNNILYLSEHCEEHQKCFYCNKRKKCKCHEKESNL